MHWVSENNRKNSTKENNERYVAVVVEPAIKLNDIKYLPLIVTYCNLK